MKVNRPRKSWKSTALKIFFGSLAAFVSVMLGEHVCAGGGFGGLGMFTACLQLGYFMSISLFELSVTLLAFSLLLSAFLDVFSNLRRVELLDRGIESVADMPVDD